MAEPNHLTLDTDGLFEADLVDIIRRLKEAEADLEQFAFGKLAGYQMLDQLLSQLNSCKNCSAYPDCPFTDPEGYVRINCFLWEGN